MREPDTIKMPEVNTIHFHAVTVMAQTHPQPLCQGKRDVGITDAITAANIAKVTIAVVALTLRATTVNGGSL